MSWYYCYSLGFKDANGKIHPLFYDALGKKVEVLTLSRSAEPEELDAEFIHMKEADAAEDFIKAFSYDYSDEDDNPGKIDFTYLSYLPIKDLPEGSAIKTKYVLIDDVRDYLIDSYNFDGFYETLTPIEYAEKLKNELILGAPAKEEDDEGGDVTPHSMRDYMLFTYIDYNSAEYYATQLRHAADAADMYDLRRKYGDEVQLVAILSQG